MINKPKNIENQLICSRLLNLAVSNITSMNSSQDCKKEALQLITDCVYENEKVQNIFSMIGGIRYLIQLLEKSLQSPPADLSFITLIIDVICASIADNGSCKSIASKEGVVKNLLSCLQHPFDRSVYLKSLICLSDLVYENDSCQSQMLELDGVAMVINIMSKSQDELISKIGTSVLQSCVKTLDDVCGKPCNEEKENVKPSSRMDPITKILDLFADKKNQLQSQKEEKVSKSKKSVKASSRSLDTGHFDEATAKKLQQFVEQLQDKTVKMSRKPRSLKQSIMAPMRKNRPENNSAINQNIVDMLTEQKNLMRNFQDDIQRLRTEIAVSSDCGGSVATMKSKHSVYKQHYNDLITSDKSVFKVPFPILDHQNMVSGTPASGRKSGVSLIRNGSQTAPSKYHHAKLNLNSNRSSANIGVGEVVSPTNNYSVAYEADERPALSQSNISRIKIANNLSSQNVSELSMREASLIEKVEKWRRSFTHEDSWGENIGKYNDEVDIIEERYDEPMELCSTPNVRQLKIYATPMQEKFVNNNSYTRQIENAPTKKKNELKRRREALVESECFIPITPESYELLGCQAKRTLNFPKITQRATADHLICKVNSEKRSYSSGFVDCSPSKHRDGICGEFHRSEKKRHGEVKQCIGCSPFSCFLSMYYNSRDLLSFIEHDSLTCRYHARIAATIAMFSSSSRPRNIEQTHGKRPLTNRNKIRPVLRPKPKAFDNMSVFSYRSTSKSKRDYDNEDDNMSCISKWTVNTNMSSRRQRQDYSDDEISFIFQGIERYGTRWTIIRNSFPFKPTRTSVDLSDKYKQMKRRGLIGHNKNSFGEDELINLQSGVKCYGDNWKKILSSYEFKPLRSESDLRMKWLCLSKAKVSP